MQAWFFYYDSDFWQLPQIEVFIFFFAHALARSLCLTWVITCLGFAPTERKIIKLKNKKKAFLEGVPDDGMILLDLWTENEPVWSITESYFGKPFS